MTMTTIPCRLISPPADDPATVTVGPIPSRRSVGLSTTGGTIVLTPEGVRDLIAVLRASLIEVSE